MSACEKCWADASAKAIMLGGSVTDHYKTLLDERKDAPCSPEEQAGQWWDKERGIDSRTGHRAIDADAVLRVAEEMRETAEMPATSREGLSWPDEVESWAAALRRAVGEE